MKVGDRVQTYDPELYQVGNGNPPRYRGGYCKGTVLSVGPDRVRIKWEAKGAWEEMTCIYEQWEVEKHIKVIDK